MKKTSSISKGEIASWHDWMTYYKLKTGHLTAKEFVDKLASLKLKPERVFPVPYLVDINPIEIDLEDFALYEIEGTPVKLFKLPNNYAIENYRKKDSEGHWHYFTSMKLSKKNEDDQIFYVKYILKVKNGMTVLERCSTAM